jgi:hypothetical protein
MGNGASKLTQAQKVDVVLRLAGYDSASAIARSLKEEFGITISPASISFYDPTPYRGRQCPERWATLFHETRAKIIAGLSDVGAAHKMVRVRWLDQMARNEMATNNSAEARALIRQAAEEMGDGVTHRHEHRGVVLHGNLSEAELDARLTAAQDRLAAVLASRGLATASAGGSGGSGGRAEPETVGGVEQARDTRPGDRPAA